MFAEYQEHMQYQFHGISHAYFDSAIKSALKILIVDFTSILRHLTVA